MKVWGRAVFLFPGRSRGIVDLAATRPAPIDVKDGSGREGEPAPTGRDRSQAVSLLQTGLGSWMGGGSATRRDRRPSPFPVRSWSARVRQRAPVSVSHCGPGEG